MEMEKESAQKGVFEKFSILNIITVGVLEKARVLS